MKIHVRCMIYVNVWTDCEITFKVNCRLQFAHHQASQWAMQSVFVWYQEANMLIANVNKAKIKS